MFRIRTPLSGVEYAPELEWRLAARFFHYTWEQFCKLPGESQSSLVAAYRANNQIESVLSHESSKKMRNRR